MTPEVLHSAGEQPHACCIFGKPWWWEAVEQHQSDSLSLWLLGEQVFAGLEEQARQAMMKNNFRGTLGDQRPTIRPLQDPDSSSSEFFPFQ